MNAIPPGTRCERSSRVVAAALTIGLLLALSGCGRAPVEERPSVLLIVVDGLRADRLEAWSGRAALEPLALDRLAARSVVFERAYAAAPWSGASLASLLTGRMPTDHGLRTPSDVLPRDATTLAELLAAAGWRTGAVVSDFRLGASRGLDQGWERFDAEEALSVTGASAEGVTSRALEYLRAGREDSRPFLLLAQYADPCAPLVVHERAQLPRQAPPQLAGLVDAELPQPVPLDLLQVMADDLTPAEHAFVAALYDGEVRATDRAVERLLDGLGRLAPSSSTWVVVVAGHGTELYDRGWFGDGHGAGEELVHVPLLVVPPGGVQARRVVEPVSLASLAPTLLDLCGLDDGGLAAQVPSLAGAITSAGPAPSGPVRVEVEHEPPGAAPGTPVAHLRATVRGRWKLIEDRSGGPARLFDLASDPLERVDLASERPNLVRQLERARVGPATP